MYADISYLELMKWAEMIENKEKLREYKKEKNKNTDNQKIKVIPDKLYFEDLS